MLHALTASKTDIPALSISLNYTEIVVHQFYKDLKL